MQRKRGAGYRPDIPLDAESEGDRDWRQLGAHLLEISRAIGTTSMLGIGMTSLIRLHTYSIFSGDGLVHHDPQDRGHIERPVSHSLTLLGPGRTCEDFHHVRSCPFSGFRAHVVTHLPEKGLDPSCTGTRALRRVPQACPGPDHRSHLRGGADNGERQKRHRPLAIVA